MKKIVKFSLVVIAILSTINSSAAGIDFSLAVKNRQGKVVSFALREVSTIKLYLFDADHRIINEEVLNADGFLSRTYDLEALPDGDYFLQAESSLKISRYSISVSGNVATLCPDAVSEIYKPVFKTVNGITSLRIDNKGKSVVSIIVVNGDGEIVYQFLTQNESIIKFFDFDSKEKEEYTFEVKYNNITFYNNVVVR